MAIRTSILLVAILGSVGTTAEPIDTFGIVQFRPSLQGSRAWTSAHWANGVSRTLKYAPDPHDPTGWTDDHSSSTDGFRIDGSGTMSMSGGGPRFHINSSLGGKVPAQAFLNTEFTAYYMRRGANGANWGGMIVGARSGPLGHASSGGNDCDATTYYARFRNDGKWDFEKELKHPGSTYWSGSGYNTQDPLWRGARLPQNRWIGMKYLVYNVPGRKHVRLELYIDTLSNGSPIDGGRWEPVGGVTDSGTWPSGDVSGCSYDQKALIDPGHGTFLLRTDNDTALYKMVSIREIDPSAPVVGIPARTRSDGLRVTLHAGVPFATLDGTPVPSSELQWHSPSGQLRSSPSRGLNILSLRKPGQGIAPIPVLFP